MLERNPLWYCNECLSPNVGWRFKAINSNSLFCAGKDFVSLVPIIKCCLLAPLYPYKSTSSIVSSITLKFLPNSLKTSTHAFLTHANGHLLTFIILEFHLLFAWSLPSPNIPPLWSLFNYWDLSSFGLLRSLCSCSLIFMTDCSVTQAFP